MKKTDRTFETHEVRHIVGLSRAEISFWTVGQFVSLPPSVHQAKGKGSRNTYSWQDVLLFALAKHMRTEGIPTVAVKEAIWAVRQKPGAEVVLLARLGGRWEAEAYKKEQAKIYDPKTGQLTLSPPIWERPRPEALSLYILDWEQLQADVGENLTKYDKKHNRRIEP